MKCACGASRIFCAGVLLQFLEINKAINNIPAENNPGIAVPINWPHLLSPVIIHNASVCKFQFCRFDYSMASVFCQLIFVELPGRVRVSGKEGGPEA